MIIKWNKSNTWVTQKITADTLIKDLTKSNTSTLTWVNIIRMNQDNFDTYFTGDILKSFNIIMM